MSILNEIFSKIYVITLENSDRHISAKEKLKGVEFEFFFGVNGKELKIDSYFIDNNKYSDIYSEKFDVDVKEINYWTPSTYGCSFSHLKLYEKIKKEGLNNVLILEENLHLLEDVYRQLPEEWDLLYLGLTNVHINYNKFLSTNYSKHLYKGGKYMCDGYVTCHGDFIFLEGTGAIVVNNNFCDIMIKNQSDPKKFFTADGAIMYYGCRELEYFVVLPQIIPQDLSIKSTN